jgi:hypothetical protein
MLTGLERFEHGGRSLGKLLEAVSGQLFLQRGGRRGLSFIFAALTASLALFLSVGSRT